MNKSELIKKIMQKKEFSQLPKKDVELVLEKFYTSDFVDEEKIKLTRELLQRTYTAFISRQLFSSRALEHGDEWILKKHISSRERFDYYNEIYGRIFGDLKKENQISVLDFGAGVNGFSYNFMKKYIKQIQYFGIEAVGQFVDLMNKYFKENKISGKAIHESLFDLENIKKIIKKIKRPRVVLFFKTVGSLENLERNYTKKFFTEIVPLVDKFVLSYATRSIFKKGLFRARRKWILKFIEDNFQILDRFELGTEEYIVFAKK